MKALKFRHAIGVSLSIAWGFIYCAVFSNLPMIQRLELDLQDSLIRLHKPAPIPNEMLLLKINQANMSGYDLHNLYKLNSFYAALLKKLFEQGARVVVLNLPEQMKQYIDIETNARLERPLREAIYQYTNQIVLVTRPNNLPSGTSALNIYNNLLPFDDESASRTIPPEQIISYFRYTPNPQNLNSPARRADLFNRFSYEDDPDPNLRHRVKSVATLALEKFYRASDDHAALEKITQLHTLPPVQINFWGPADTFPSLSFQLQCASSQVELDQCHGLFSPQSLQMLRGKLVLVDLPEGKASEDYRERSPYGELSIAEVEANLIASLVTHSFLTVAPNGSVYIITMVGLVVMSLHSTGRSSKSRSQLVYRPSLWLFLGVIGGYMALSLVCFWQGLMLPLSIPLIGWLSTGTGIATYVVLRQSAQQQQKLAERQAALLQARKLLHRVATDIHDGPLQELKLVMDSLELLGINQPSPLTNQLLDRLEAIGLALRNQLTNTRTLAEKLEITPELEFGLAQGIHQWLQQLSSTGELNLVVREHLQPLQEPKFDSAWIDAREDIFRFFREAIANVIRHAQPPHGAATQVSIHLSQEGVWCSLVVSNDGTPIEPTVPSSTELNSTIRERKDSGYGTKLMATIAAQLPNGDWQRVPLKFGGMQVTLRWAMGTV